MKINEAFLLLCIGFPPRVGKLSGRLVSSMYNWSEYSFFLEHSERERQRESVNFLVAFCPYLCASSSHFPITHSPTAEPHQLMASNGIQSLVWLFIYPHQPHSLSVPNSRIRFILRPFIRTQLNIPNKPNNKQPVISLYPSNCSLVCVRVPKVCGI